MNATSSKGSHSDTTSSHRVFRILSLGIAQTLVVLYGVMPAILPATAAAETVSYSVSKVYTDAKAINKALAGGDDVVYTVTAADISLLNNKSNSTIDSSGAFSVHSPGGGIKLSNGSELTIANLASMNIAAGLSQSSSTTGYSAVFFNDGSLKINNVGSVNLTDSRQAGFSTVHLKSASLMDMNAAELSVTKTVEDGSATAAFAYYGETSSRGIFDISGSARWNSNAKGVFRLTDNSKLTISADEFIVNANAESTYGFLLSGYSETTVNAATANLNSAGQYAVYLYDNAALTMNTTDMTVNGVKGLQISKESTLKLIGTNSSEIAVTASSAVMSLNQAEVLIEAPKVTLNSAEDRAIDAKNESHVTVRANQEAQFLANGNAVVMAAGTSSVDLDAKTLTISGHGDESRGLFAYTNGNINAKSDDMTVYATIYGLDVQGNETDENSAVITIAPYSEDNTASNLRIYMGYHDGDDFQQTGDSWAMRAYDGGTIVVASGSIETNAGLLAKSLVENAPRGQLLIGTYTDKGPSVTTVSVNPIKTGQWYTDAAIKAVGNSNIEINAKNVLLTDENNITSHGIWLWGREDSGNITGTITINASEKLSVANGLYAENTEKTSTDNRNFTININQADWANAATIINGDVTAVNANTSDNSLVQINLRMTGYKSALNGSINTVGTRAETHLVLNDNATWNVTGNSNVTSIESKGGYISTPGTFVINVGTLTTDWLVFKTDTVMEKQMRFDKLVTNLESKYDSITIVVNEDAFKDLGELSTQERYLKTMRVIWDVDAETAPAMPSEAPSAASDDWDDDLDVTPTSEPAKTEKDAEPSGEPMAVADDELDDNPVTTLVTETTEQTDPVETVVAERTETPSESETEVATGTVPNPTVVITGGELAEETIIRADDSGNIVSVVTKENPVVGHLFEIQNFNYLMFRTHINDLDKRMGDLRTMKHDYGLWARGYAGESRYSKAQLKSHYQALQLGSDFLIDNFYLGVTFGYKHATNKANLGNSKEKLYSFGFYGGWLGEKGQFLDVIVKQHRIGTDYTLYNGSKVSTGHYWNWATSVSVETGWRFGDPKGGFFVEPSIEFMFGRLNSVAYKTSRNVEIQQVAVKTSTGRIGNSVGYVLPDNRGSVYAKASVLRDWDGKTKSTASYSGQKLEFRERMGGTWAEFAAGGTARIGKKVYAYGEFQSSAGNPIRSPWQVSLGACYMF